MRRAVITGLGAVTPIGKNVEDFWAALTSGQSGVRRITLFDPSDQDCQIAAEVKDWNPDEWMEPKAARRAARFSQFAVAAAKQAVADSDLQITDANRDDIAIAMNTGGGGVDIIAEGEETYLEKGANRVGPFTVPAYAPNMASCQVAINLGIRGPTMTSVAACAAGVFSFIEAKRLIDLGEADVVVAGGAEANIIPISVAAMANMRALSTRNDEPEKACRPFDKDRDGFVYGEGAGAFVIETLDYAQARGARIYAELAGGAITSDAFHITAPDPSGETSGRAISKALERSGLASEDVDVIIAHGTGTPLNDAAETAAIKRALGEHAYKVAVSAPKSMVGHQLGAAGAISGLAAVLTLERGFIPPTINLETPDPECDLDYVPLVARRHESSVTLVNGFGFGGQNGVAAFKRFGNGAA
ncbi:MAG TPA: beta-ketoacyl-ACP synthase II [Dehalococcoidia bacterium]|nr:beta-ketoacyl-ACP synthase II [Dehalococcoidia bacterium]